MPENPWADWGGETQTQPELQTQEEAFKNVPGKGTPENPYQGYISPYEERVGDMQHVIPNLGKDIEQQAAGISAVTSVPYLRAYEVAQGQPLFRSTDLPQITKAVSDIPKYYWHEYGMPLMDELSHPMQPGHGLIGSHMLEHFLKAPLSTALDLGIPTGAKAAAQAIGKTAIPGKVVGAVAKGVEKFAPQSFKDFYAEHIAPRVETMLPGPAKEMHEYVQNRLLEADRWRHEQINKGFELLHRHYSKISPEYKKVLAAVSEYTTDPNLDSLRRVPEIQKFLQTSRRFNTLFEKTFGIPEDINLRQKYGGAYLKRLKELNSADATTFADLSQPGHMKGLTELKASMERKDELPVHNPLVTPEQLAAGLHRAESRFLGGITKSPTADLAKQVAETGKSAYERSPDYLPPYLKERESAKLQELNLGKEYPHPLTTIREAKHAADMLQLQHLQLTRLYKFMAIKDFVSDLLKKKPEPGWVELNIKDALKNLTGQEATTVEQFFKELDPTHKDGIVKLPPKTAQLVQNILAGKGDWHPILRFIEKWVNHPVRMARFTLDPVFGIHLAMQTAAVQLWKTRTPKEALTLLTSHILAAHPMASNAVPDALMLTHGTHIASPKLLQAGLNFEKLLAAKGHFDYTLLHNTQRRAVALQFLLYGMKDSPKSLQHVFADVLNIQATLERAKALTFNGEALKAMQNDLKPYFGDYSGEVSKTFSRRLLKFGFVAGAWLPHAMWLVSTIPNHPIKAALGSIFAKMMAQQIQQGLKKGKEYGYIPMPGHREPSGKPKMFQGPKLDALEAGLKMLRTAANLLFNSGSAPEIASTINPIPQLGIEAFTHFDLSTRKPFERENPAIYPSGYGFKTTVGHKRIPYTDEAMAPYRFPNPLLRAAEVAFPKQVKPLKTLATYNRKTGALGQPSPFGTPKSFKHKLLTSDWEDFWLNQLGLHSRGAF